MAATATPAVASALPPDDLPDHLAEMSEDEAALAALGYKQEFKVRYKFNIIDQILTRRLINLKARVLRMDNICSQLRSDGLAP